MTASTHVDVDPCMVDATWLREFAARLTKREHVNPPFPENGMCVICSKARLIHTVFDFEVATSSGVRLLFTLADIDEL